MTNPRWVDRALGDWFGECEVMFHAGILKNSSTARCSNEAGLAHVDYHLCLPFHLEEAVRGTGQPISIILFIINNIFFASGISVPITFERLLQPLPSLFIAQNSRFSSWLHPKLGAEAFDIYSVYLPLSLSFKNPLLLAIKGNRSYRSMMENTSREAAQMDRRC